MGITRKQAYDLFRSDDLIGLGMEADRVRRDLHPEGVVTYALDRVLPVHERSSLRHDDAASAEAWEALHRRISAIIATGSNGISLELSPAPPADFGEVESVVTQIRNRYAEISLSGIITPEMLSIMEASNLSIPDAVQRLRDAGLDSLLCQDSAVSDHRTPSLATQPGASPWLQIHRAAHRLGMRTIATAVFGTGDSLEERVEYLDAIRQLQEETAGFASFVPYCAKLDRALDETTGVEYLKILAVSRLYLDNIENLQTTWSAQGLKVLQMGLRFGSNDAGSVMSQEPGRTAALTTEEELRRLIRDAGFQPVQRDATYRTLYLN